MAGPVMLIIRDGWGINSGGKKSREQNGDATLLASTPFHDQLYRDYPGSTLSASGSDVGLPKDQMGNSEVGHLNIGAGRVVWQDVVRIDLTIKKGEVDKVEVAIMPVLLGGGIALLPSIAQQTKLSLSSHKLYRSGIVSLVYEVKK